MWICSKIISFIEYKEVPERSSVHYKNLLLDLILIGIMAITGDHPSTMNCIPALYLEYIIQSSCLLAYLVEAESVLGVFPIFLQQCLSVDGILVFVVECCTEDNTE